MLGCALALLPFALTETIKSAVNLFSPRFATQRDKLKI